MIANNFRSRISSFLYKKKISFKNKFINILLDFLKSNGYILAPQKNYADFHITEYRSYKEYKDTQIYYNKMKINKVFADKKTLTRVGNIVLREFPGESKIKGICHGSRNSFEQNFLRSFSNRIETIGTDISETAKNYENSVHWDYHDINKDWVGEHAFIYTNSLDHSWQPKVALQTLFAQLKPNGLLIIEHTEGHSPTNADKMDQFGVKPTVMPYVLTLWFGSQISIEHSVSEKSNKRKYKAWLFVIKKNVKDVLILE